MNKLESQLVEHLTDVDCGVLMRLIIMHEEYLDAANKLTIEDQKYLECLWDKLYNLASTYHSR